MYSIIKCYLRHILAVCMVSLSEMTGTTASSLKLDVDRFLFFFFFFFLFVFFFLGTCTDLYSG